MTLEEKIKQLEDKMKRAKDISKVLGVIASDILKEEQLNFKGNKDPEGVPWKPLSKKTILLKQQRGRNANAILRDKGLLFGSLHAVLDDNAAIVATGPEIDYARKHQYGEGVPKRQFAGINKRNVKKYNKWAMKYIEEGILTTSTKL